MNKKNKAKLKASEKRLECVAYLSTDGNIDHAEDRERKQLKVIKEYAKAHNIVITKILHRDVVGQAGVDRHFRIMVNMVNAKKVDGIIVFKMLSIAPDETHAYEKIGAVHKAGGEMITVEEGKYSRYFIKKGDHYGKENI